MVFPNSEIHRGVCVTGLGVQENDIFLSGARVVGKAFLAIRRTILFYRNPFSFVAGSILKAATGDNPTIQQIARFVFGTLSMIRCAEDIVKLKNLTLKCKRIMAGEYYIPLKGDRWGEEPDPLNQMQFDYRMKQLRFFKLMETIGKIINVFIDLILHLGDAYIAFNGEESVTEEVFIHGGDLWEKLTSDATYLRQQLKKNETITKWAMGRMSWTEQTIVKVIDASAEFFEECKDWYKKMKQQGGEMIDGAKTWHRKNGEKIEDALDVIRGIPKELRALDRTPEPDSLRFIDPPKKRMRVFTPTPSL